MVDKHVFGKGKQLRKVQKVEQGHGGHYAGCEEQKGQEKTEKLAPFPSKARQNSYSKEVEHAHKDAESAGIGQQQKRSLVSLDLDTVLVLLQREREHMPYFEKRRCI